MINTSRPMNREEYATHWQKESSLFETNKIYEKLSNITPIANTIEVGCGAGYSTYHLAKSRTVLVIENNNSCIDFMKCYFEKNNQNTIKILIGIIIGLSVFILLGGIFYIFNMQSKLTKLERNQMEQLKKQMESQNMASIQSVPNIQQIRKSTTNSVTPKNTNPKISSKKKSSIYITKSTSGPVNVREKATMNSNIVAKLPDNVNLKFISRNGSWYYVSYNVNGYNEYGYINKSQLVSANSKKNQNVENRQTENKKMDNEILEKCKNYRIYADYSDYEIEKAIKDKYYIRMNPPTFSEFDKMKALQESTNAKLEASEEIMNAKNCKAMINKWKK